MKPWTVRDNIHALGTAYLITPEGAERGFFQRKYEAEVIADALNAYATLVADRAALLEALKESIVWLVLSTSNTYNPKSARNALNQLRKNIRTIKDAGGDPEIREAGLDEIGAAIARAEREQK